MSKILSENIIYEDNHLIAINKSSGQLSQGDKTGDESLIDLLKAYIKTTYNKPGNVFLGSVHRLDRPTSGVLIFTKTSKATSRMNELFKSRNMDKSYYAICHNKANDPFGKLTHYLIKDSKTNTVKAFDKERSGAKKAELSYETVCHIEGKTLVRVNPKTGRSHQIRVQLSSIGMPIIGDLKYGAKEGLGQSIGLHCHSMAFIHPVKKEAIRITAPAPNNQVWNKFKTYMD